MHKFTAEINSAVWAFLHENRHAGRWHSIRSHTTVKQIFMAELTVQPKKRTSWIWLILLLVVLAVLSYFLFFNKRVENTTPANTATPVTTTTSPSTP
jgi:drug/metabolite transporter (DMT)-like permease